MPETFNFRGNAWYRSDGGRLPQLPLEEVSGIYQVDPMMKDAETSTSMAMSKDPRLKGIGAHSFKPAKVETGEEKRTNPLQGDKE